MFFIKVQKHVLCFLFANECFNIYGFNKGETCHFGDYLSPAGFFMGETF